MKRSNSTMLTLSLLAGLLAARGATAQACDAKTLTLEGAKRIIAAAAAKARKDGAGGSIAIVDGGGHLLALERLDGTFPASADIAAGKARTAALFQKPTRVFEEIINKGRTSMTTLPGFFPLQGGVPIEIGGQVAGAIGVSGAKSAQHDDEIAIAGAEAAKAMPAECSRPAAEVAHLRTDRVSAAFAKGEPLLEVESYKIHASRREAPGQAEIHTRDTDIIYVTEGSATLVTGGRISGGKETAADEVRGASIEGGEARRISKGDVIVVPAGTPHWFRDVPGPITYYVVKVTAQAGGEG